MTTEGTNTYAPPYCDAAPAPRPSLDQIMRGMQSHIQVLLDELKDEREAKNKAENALRDIRLGLSDCFSNIISGGAYDPAAIIQNTMKQIDAALSE